MTKMEVSIPSKCVWDAMLPTPVIVSYLGFGAFALSMYHFVAEREFSSILTMAVIAQAMAIASLCIQVLWSKSAAGISVSSLMLDGLAVVLRMPATMWSYGYLPVDSSGDYVYQTVDFCTLTMILFLLHRVQVRERRTYQSSEDSFQIKPLVLFCFCLAAVFHGNAADNPVFDTCWMAGLFVGAGAVLPKLWLLTQSGGTTHAMTCHYIAGMGMSRALSGLFMWEAREDITCFVWVTGFNHAIVFVLLAHAVHLLLLCDFACSYVKSLAKHGIGLTNPPQMDLPQNVQVELPQWI